MTLAIVLKYAKLVLLSLLVTLTPIKAMAITAISLVFLDLLFGLAAAIKKKDPITSSGIKRTPLKLLVYISSIIVSFIMQKYLMGDAVPLTNMVGTLIAVTEGKSIGESLDIINGGPFLSAIIQKLVDTTSR